jgi:hypothetical protein
MKIDLSDDELKLITEVLDASMRARAPARKLGLPELAERLKVRPFRSATTAAGACPA